MIRRRLDAELVRRGLSSSRSDAQVAVTAGRVLVRGSVALKSTRLVAPDEPVVISGPPPRFVSRGGDKLDAALDRFEIAVAGRYAVDVGASTGGFTDCLLQRQASHVLSIDVGHGQLHERMIHHPRVTNLERTNVRAVDVAALGGPFSLVVVDLSFISLKTVARKLLELLAVGGDMVALEKPQFEAGRAEVSKGRGVIRDAEIHQRVCDDVEHELVQRGTVVLGWCDSPITGAEGNREFLVHVRHQ